MKRINYFDLKLILFFLLVNLILPIISTIELTEVNNLPKSPNDLADNSLEYFNNKWQDFASNNIIFKPLNSLFLDNQTIFLILFNVQYSFSISFISIFLIWLFFLFKLNRIFKLFQILKTIIRFLIALLFTILLAKINLFNILASLILNLLYDVESFILRVVLIIAILFMFFILSYIINLLCSIIMGKINSTEKNNLKKNQKNLDNKVSTVQNYLISKAKKDKSSSEELTAREEKAMDEEIDESLDSADKPEEE